MDYHIGEDNILDISFDHILLQWSRDSLFFGGIMEWDFLGEKSNLMQTYHNFTDFPFMVPCLGWYLEGKIHVPAV